MILVAGMTFGQSLDKNNRDKRRRRSPPRGTAYFGYNNSSSSPVVIPKGVLSRNFFQPLPTSYPNQPTIFQPGINDNVFGLTFGGQAGNTLTYTLDSGSVSAVNGQNQSCAVITYQGRLSNAGAPASGNYDFQFTVFDAVSGGTVQSGIVTATNVVVTNGVFTAPLNFASVFNGNNSARYLEIAVRREARARSPIRTFLNERDFVSTMLKPRSKLCTKTKLIAASFSQRTVIYYSERLEPNDLAQALKNCLLISIRLKPLALIGVVRQLKLTAIYIKRLV